jgi:ElaB/YqjD/DUF883 family membrane-anchored ribosome-binding protein
MTEENKVGAAATAAARDQASEVVDDLRSATSGVTEEYRGKAEQIWSDALERSRTFQEDSENYVRQNPTKAIISALGIGLVLGLIFRR